MTPHEDNRAAMARELEARLSAYLAAVAERDALPGDTDPASHRRAESRVKLALDTMRRWKDPIPAASTATTIASPAASLSPLGRAGGMSRPTNEADRLADEVIAAALGTTLPNAKTEADRLADEIIASAQLADA
jgi:hypothetical protein